MISVFDDARQGNEFKFVCQDDEEHENVAYVNLLPLGNWELRWLHNDEIVAHSLLFKGEWIKATQKEIQNKLKQRIAMLTNLIDTIDSTFILMERSREQAVSELERLRLKNVR